MGWAVQQRMLAQPGPAEQVGRTVSISPGTEGSVVVAEDTPKEGVT